jgi:hypothetical protein
MSDDLGEELVLVADSRTTALFLIPDGGPRVPVARRARSRGHQTYETHCAVWSPKCPS